VTAIIFIVFLITRTLQRFTHPLGDMISALTRMQSGDYAVRVAERGPRVMRTLTRSFNTMAARLQANDESRRAMLADVTHELRTPLTVIRGNLEGLLDGIYPRDDAHLKPLLEETHTMSRLVDDLRTLALAEGGALQLEREPTDLAWLAKDVLASLRAKADEAEVHLELHAPASLPQVEVDPVRIREVMMNLVSNALRYTPANGTIAVSFEASPSHIKTTVRDTGKGIAPEVLPHVFDRFYKSRDSSGSGLGLAIARQLVEAHGGSVAATSALGAGTQITFALPLNKAV
jgi:signal transduction histidine kinase